MVKHQHAGKSSKQFLDAHQVLKQLDLQQNQVVLDLGCGEGHFALAAAEWVGKSGRVFALDVHAASLEILQTALQQSHTHNVCPLLADATQRIPLADNSVDWVFMVNVLHGFYHNGELDAVMAEIRRIHKADGKLMIIEFDRVPETPGPPLDVRIPSTQMNATIYPYGYFLYKSWLLTNFLYLGYYKRQPQSHPTTY